MKVATNRLMVALAIAALVGGVVGYFVGRTFVPVAAVRHVGVVVGSGDNGISIEADGWTYSVPLELTWIDSGNSFHMEGRPECLPPGIGRIQIKFYSVEVVAEGLGWRPVVLVDCR